MAMDRRSDEPQNDGVHDPAPDAQDAVAGTPTPGNASRKGATGREGMPARFLGKTTQNELTHAVLSPLHRQQPPRLRSPGGALATEPDACVTLPAPPSDASAHAPPAQRSLTILPRPISIRGEAAGAAPTRREADDPSAQRSEADRPSAHRSEADGPSVHRSEAALDGVSARRPSGERPRGQAPLPALAPLHSAPRSLRAVPPARKHDPQTRLFRTEALAAYARGARVASVLRITSGSRWGLLVALGLALCMAIGVTAFGYVEETSSARGILRAAFGVQPVVAGVTGTVREVAVSAGTRMRPGDLIARIDAAPLEAELQAAEQRLASVEQEWSEARRVITSTHAHARRDAAGRAPVAAEPEPPAS